MRPYRGLTKEGKWVYGNYIYLRHDDGGESHFIQEVDAKWYSAPEYNRGWSHDRFEVIPETVGQYTGLCDKNGKEGYRSDKVSFGSTRPIYLIKWSICNAGFYLESMDEQKEHLGISNLTVGEIIGNIHQEQENGS